MPTRNVVLTDHHEALIASLVNAGRYQNASEVLREGLRLIEQRETENALKLEVLRAAAKEGFDDIEQGRFFDISDDGLEDYILTLGRRATERTQGAGK